MKIIRTLRLIKEKLFFIIKYKSLIAPISLMGKRDLFWYERVVDLKFFSLAIYKSFHINNNDILINRFVVKRYLEGYRKCLYFWERCKLIIFQFMQLSFRILVLLYPQYTGLEHFTYFRILFLVRQHLLKIFLSFYSQV